MRDHEWHRRNLEALYAQCGTLDSFIYNVATMLEIRDEKMKELKEFMYGVIAERVAENRKIKMQTSQNR